MQPDTVLEMHQFKPLEVAFTKTWDIHNTGYRGSL